MNDVLVKNVGEALRRGDLARLLEGMQAELDGLTRIERAILATCLAYDLSADDMAELEVMGGEDGRAWRGLRDAIGLRILPGGTPQVWAGEELPAPLPGEASADAALASMVPVGRVQ